MREIFFTTQHFFCNLFLNIYYCIFFFFGESEKKDTKENIKNSIQVFYASMILSPFETFCSFAFASLQCYLFFSHYFLGRLFCVNGKKKDKRHTQKIRKVSVFFIFLSFLFCFVLGWCFLGGNKGYLLESKFKEFSREFAGA